MSSIKWLAVAVVCAAAGLAVACPSYNPADGDAVVPDAKDYGDAKDSDDPDAHLYRDAAADAAAGDGGPVVCGDVGGVCTSTPGTVCPPGTLFFADDESLGCGGHCCLPDQPSTCNSEPSTNCSPGAACSGCWAPASDTSLSCATGRPCCEWSCE